MPIANPYMPAPPVDNSVYPNVPAPTSTTAPVNPTRRDYFEAKRKERSKALNDLGSSMGNWYENAISYEPTPTRFTPEAPPISHIKSPDELKQKDAEVNKFIGDSAKKWEETSKVDEKKKYGNPYAKTDQQISILKKGIEEYLKKPTKVDISPLLALADAWGGSNLAAAYKHPETPEEKAKIALELKAKLADKLAEREGYQYMNEVRERIANQEAEGRYGETAKAAKLGKEIGTLSSRFANDRSYQPNLQLIGGIIAGKKAQQGQVSDANIEARDWLNYHAKLALETNPQNPQGALIQYMKDELASAPGK